MTAREAVDEFCDAQEIALIVADGWDDAIVGIGSQFDKFFVVYSVAAILKTLIERDGMSSEDAREYFEFNIALAYVGPGTPVFMFQVGDDDDVH